ncbi:hypothetical protein [Oceanobacillus saliphilus]|uniref:hypothetical protein n=1 Tax=Oceanobacillus saliphilus TaxID=2925834 RepID=UPI00201D47BF|nr:hypothetical protein [Oceanobacillus saliphilus]
MKVFIINCFDTYEHRVDLLYGFFKANGDTVKVYTSNFRHFDKVERNDNKNNYIYVKANPYYKNLSLGRLYSHYKLSRDIFDEIKNQEVDLVWVLIPPNSFVEMADRYKRAYPNTKLIFDVIDLWPETMPIHKFKSLPPFSNWRNLRDKKLNVADIVVTECSLYHEILKPVVGQNKLQTIYLARQVNEIKINPQLPQNDISICYLVFN